MNPHPCVTHNEIAEVETIRNHRFDQMHKPIFGHVQAWFCQSLWEDELGVFILELEKDGNGWWVNGVNEIDFHNCRGGTKKFVGNLT